MGLSAGKDTTGTKPKICCKVSSPACWRRIRSATRKRVGADFATFSWCACEIISLARSKRLTRKNGAADAALLRGLRRLGPCGDVREEVYAIRGRRGLHHRLVQGLLQAAPAGG